jgi:hypothetical protein
MKTLGELSLQEYEKLKQAGMLWEMYPDATGHTNTDLEALCYERTRDDGSKYYFYDFIDESYCPYCGTEYQAASRYLVAICCMEGYYMMPSSELTEEDVADFEELTRHGNN